MHPLENRVREGHKLSLASEATSENLEIAVTEPISVSD